MGGTAAARDEVVDSPQANAGQVFLIQMDSNIESHGSIEENTLASAAGARPAKTNNQKH